MGTIYLVQNNAGEIYGAFVDGNDADACLKVHAERNVWVVDQYVDGLPASDAPEWQLVLFQHHLNRQVTQLQAKCTEQLNEIRDLKWRLEGLEK